MTFDDSESRRVITCSCGNEISIPDESPNELVSCPVCGKVMEIPAASPPPAANGSSHLNRDKRTRKRAEALIHEGRYAEARDLFMDVLSRHGTDPKAWYGAGYCYYKLGSLEKSRFALMEAAARGHGPARNMLRWVERRLFSDPLSDLEKSTADPFQSARPGLPGHRPPPKAIPPKSVGHGKRSVQSGVPWPLFAGAVALLLLLLVATGVLLVVFAFPERDRRPDFALLEAAPEEIGDTGDAGHIDTPEPPGEVPEEPSVTVAPEAETGGTPPPNETADAATPPRAAQTVPTADTPSDTGPATKPSSPSQPTQPSGPYLAVPLVYIEQRGASRTWQLLGNKRLNVLSEAPPGEYRLPPINRLDPAYALVSLAGVNRLLLLDSRSPSDPFFSRLYFDGNANGDLTDDPVVEVEPVETSGGFQARFPPVPAAVETDGVSLPYSIGFTARHTRPPVISRDSHSPALVLSCGPLCGYVGEFMLNGMPYEIALADANCNGRFDDKGDDQHETSSDHFYIRAADAPLGRVGQAFGDWLMIQHVVHEITVEAARGRVVLAPLPDATCAFVAPMPTEQATFSWGSGDRRMMTYRFYDRARVPPGSYRIVRYTAYRAGFNGELWTLSAEGSSAGPAAVDVMPHSVVSASYGEPFELAVFGPSRRLGRGGIPLEFRFVGKGGETVRDLSLAPGTGLSSVLLSSRRPSRPKEPVYRITTPRGVSIATGPFRYEEGLSCSATWDGSATPGRYHVHCEYEPGPFQAISRVSELRL